MSRQPAPEKWSSLVGGRACFLIMVGSTSMFTHLVSDWWKYGKVEQ